jgi:hypothetical protein
VGTAHDLLYEIPQFVLSLSISQKQQSILANHWQGKKGLHQIQLAQSADLEFKFPTNVASFDWGFSPAPIVANFKTTVVTAAVGYNISTLESFVGTLKEFYDGDVKMLISDHTSDEIRIYLRKHHIDVVETSEGKSWEEFNRF